jgi:hypothetical protein
MQSVQNETFQRRLHILKEISHVVITAVIPRTPQRYIGNAIDFEHAHLMWKHAVEFRWPGTTPNISVTQQVFPERPIYMKMWYNCIPSKTSRLSLNY